jgi:pimeloyl-ACP methyl ester carboxylesterase
MHDNAAALERAGFDQTIWKQLGGLRTPILLVYGTRDAAAVAAARRFNATTASVAEFVVDGGGHHPLFEDKSTVEAVRAFVAEHLG